MTPRGGRLTKETALEGDVPRWQDSAECKGQPTSWWFPSKAPELARAKVICNQCTVRRECLLETNSFDYDDHGVFGGLTPDERWVFRNHYRLGKDYDKFLT